MLTAIKINNRIFFIVFFILFILTGCRTSFSFFSKKISKKYDIKKNSLYDIKFNSPTRIFLKKKGYLNGYNLEKDTIIFIQYSNYHIGDNATVLICNSSIQYPFSDTNQFGRTDEQTIPNSFIDLVKKWDTVSLRSLKEQKLIHKSVVFVSMIRNGEVFVMNPKSYDW